MAIGPVRLPGRLYCRSGCPRISRSHIARLAALVPRPRANLTRYHGVLAPNHHWRGLVTPARRGKGTKSISNAELRTPAERHTAMTWAQRLKRVFGIDIEVCASCGGSADAYTVNDEALSYMRAQGLPAAPRRRLAEQAPRVSTGHPAWCAVLAALAITGPRHIRIATEGALLGTLIAQGVAPDLAIVSDDAGQYVNKRKISGSTRSDEGRRCRDTFASLKKTCRKHDATFWTYLRDRLFGSDVIPPLANWVFEPGAAAFAGSIDPPRGR